MAKIYTEQQTTELYNSTGEPGGAVEAQRVRGYARQMDADAQRYEQQAKQTYSTALKISASDTMNQLYAQYPDDPVKLQEEFKKAYDKSVGEIADNDVKVDFMANMTLQSQSYISKAIDNKKKKDYRIMKSTTFDGIDKNTQMLGLSFSTLLGDDFNPDNVGVYNIALNNNNAMINTLNDDGTYMFTDEQRKRMRDDMDKAHLFALKTNFDDMEPYKKDSYMKLLAYDAVEIPVGVDEDKNIIRKNLRDIVTPESYEKFKDYAERVYERKQKLLKKYGGLSEEEADALAQEQDTNHTRLKGMLEDIKILKKENKAKKTVEGITRNLEMLDVLEKLNDSKKVSDTDYKSYRKSSIDELYDSINPLKHKSEDDYDDAAISESVMSVGLQAMRNDGQIGTVAWSKDMSVVMLRDFYAMLKESGLDPRATDSGSRESARKLASKAIKNTIIRVVGGYGKEFNSMFLNGRKVSIQPIEREDKVGYVNTDYMIQNGQKIYKDTGIKVDL